MVCAFLGHEAATIEGALILHLCVAAKSWQKAFINIDGVHVHIVTSILCKQLAGGRAHALHCAALHCTQVQVRLGIS
jgi:hypothetical protein